MRDLLDSNIIFNSILMIRPECSGLILVTEGDYDSFTLKNHLESRGAEVIAAGNKPTALEVAQKVRKNNLPGVRFLVDADFDRYTGKSAPTGVITSLSHDLTMDLILNSMPLLERVIELAIFLERSSGEISSTPTEILNEGFELASSLVSFRIANEKHSLGVNFKEFPFGKLNSINPSDIEIAELLLRRSKVDISLDNLVDYARSEAVENKRHKFNLVGDHDFWSALAEVARANGVRKANGKDLEQKFLVAFRCSAVMATSWYQELSEWSSRENKQLFTCPSCD